MTVLATAGHVDHGKSTLVKTLTGTDPDRWAEERERGLTIDLGFAHLVTPTGRDVSFVDVPGHVRFIGNMLAGVGAIQGCLFVVDVREGWMPQSEEHLRVLDLLGVERGIVVLTKVDLVDDDPDHRDLVTLDLEDRVRGTFLEGAAIVPVSSHTGAGIADLLAAIDMLLADAPDPRDRGRPRLYVDRVFAAKGSGTVVTGTSADGEFRVGDTMIVGSGSHGPGRRECRVRSIQTHGHTVESIGPGHRVALNLSGVEHTEIERGDVLTRRDEWHHTDRFDASLTVLASLDHPVSRRGAYSVHIGSADVPARLRVIGPDTIAAGSTGTVRIHLDRPFPLLPGDRFVVRESGRQETVGGGEILDVDPILPVSRARPDRSVERVIVERGWIAVDEFMRLTGEHRPADVNGWIVDPEVLDRMRDELSRLVDTSGESGLDLGSLDERRRAVLSTIPEFVIDGDRVRRPGVVDPLLTHPVIETLRAQGCAPNQPEGVAPGDLRRLARLGLLFERDGIWFHVAALDTARDAARRLLDEDPNGFTMSQFRDRLGITRKHAVPLATELDTRGMTRRRDDLRIEGPRLRSGSSGT
ncbi:MAG: selenocysteine-specific elongation factor [Actinomycetota bacterium]